jgi:hypothetical protein
MSFIRLVIRKGFSAVAVIVLSGVLSLGTFGGTLAADSSDCTPPPASQPGVSWPTGSDAGTFTYQCAGQYAGEWTNAYYVYNPADSSRTPLYSPDYTYDCASGQWYMTNWTYSPADSQFHESQVATSAPAGLPTNCPVAAATTNPTTNSGTNSTDPIGTNPNTISNTGPGSTNTTNLTGNNTLNNNNTNTLGVTNNLTGTATSGNSLVLGNTTAGDAASGNTLDQADIINMLQSGSNALGSGSNVITFTDNINGDVNGNLLLNPAALTSIQGTGPGSTNSGNTNLNNTLTVNNSTGAAINNNVNLAANSGNATVSGNTNGGNATSGNAEAIANVVNMIDSAITAGHSFIGTININGDLNGDILLPPDFINQLLADNVPTVTLTGPGSTNTANTTTNNNTTVTNTNNEGVNNTVNGSAASGAATVSDNTSGGSAASGNANTKITAFNLTGSNVIGSNDLLVFVNVTGTWVGLILNAPAGTTAAEFGGGITSTGPGSTNTTNTTTNNNATINNTANEQINNNITTSANSGNAAVTYNTKGGNATSGNADNAVNLLNVEGSTINLSGWFGILFINVFGTWNGNFGVAPVDTGAVASAGNTGSIGGSGASSTGTTKIPQVFRFIPTSGGNNFNIVSLGTGSSGSGAISNTGPGSTNAVLAAHVKANPIPTPALTPGHFNWLLAGSGVSAFFVYLLAERLYAIRRNQKSL